MITTMLNDEGVLIGQFKVRRLMGELGLICKQPGPHAYKQATVERPDIPNRLNREFSVSCPDLAWCGDITCIWAGQRWSYLAVVLDLYARRIVGWALSDRPDAELVVKALDHSRKADWGSVPLRPGQSVRQSIIPSEALALPHGAKHESPGKLLG
jgi:putative transposase